MNCQATETPDSGTDETKLRIMCCERLGGRLKHYSLRAASSQRFIRVRDQLLIPRALMREASVVGFIPSSAAAPSVP